jgi:glycosyltransferase involved in cell wall biosynthesis
MFGDGPMEEQLKQQTWRFRQHLTFFGDSAFPELCHSSIDCLILTSKWEGFPNVVLEAMSCGRPVVAVRMPATEEMIEDGVTGILTDDDPDAMADAVVYILANPAMAAGMGAAARRRVEAVYSMERMVKAYEQLYLDLAGGDYLKADV